MLTKKEKGDWAEKLAVDYLGQLGFAILATKFRFQRAEIDIIALSDNKIWAIEVKYRSTQDFGNPEEFFSKSQESRLIDAIANYAEQNAHDGEVTIGVIGINPNTNGTFDIRFTELEIDNNFESLTSS